jgi:dipeptidyl aminopeptidase/acylaminoacyl peptidase
MPTKTKRPTAAEDLYDFQLISEPRISPDGKNVCYTLQRVDRKTEKKYTNLWLVSTEGGAARPFTIGDHNDGHGRWSPDSSQIAFLSNRGDKERPAQIYLIPLNGGEARPLTSLDGEIQELAWSPDGRRLLCVVRKLDPQQLERLRDEQKKKLGVVSRRYDRLFYKLDGYGYLPHERAHLWMVDARSGRARQLTGHPVYDERDPAWSPDGQWIAFVSNRSDSPDDTPDRDDVYLMPAAGGDPRPLPAPAGAKFRPAFSPDGKWIAYLGQDGENLWHKNTELWLAPTDGSAPARSLTAASDLHLSAWTINDQGTPEEMPPTWSRGGERITFQVCQAGSSLLYSIRADGTNLRYELGEGVVVGAYTFDAAQKKMAYFFGTPSDPCQVRLRDMDDEQDRPLTAVNKAVFERTEPGDLDEVWIKGPDGNDLQGWILKPPGFDPAKKYPSILEIHGGPLTQYGRYYMHEFQFLAAGGYVVHFCNPRGGRGYGEAHAGAIQHGWGDADYRDLMAWTDYIQALSYVDPQRMGVTGGSYGGYMTVWIIGHTQRFKAAVTQRCVSNLVSMWGSSDLNWVFQLTLNDRPPFEDLQKYWDHSPIKYIGNARTPTLVIHNENDLRCPIEQGEQVYVALKRLGVETAFVRFPDEFHGLSRTGRTDRRIARLNAIRGWFDGHL